MPILTFTPNWLTLPPRHILYNFTTRLVLIFSPGTKISLWHWRWGCFLFWGKNKFVTLGMRLLWKCIRKAKLVYIFCYNFLKFSEFEAEILGYNEKNMGFHLTLKKILLPVELWGMGMQWEHPILIHVDKCVMYAMIISQLSLKWIFGSSSNMLFVELKWKFFFVFVQEHIEGTYNPAQLVKASDIVASLVYNRDKHLSGQVLVAWYPWQNSRAVIDCRNYPLSEYSQNTTTYRLLMAVSIHKEYRKKNHCYVRIGRMSPLCWMG